MSEDANYSQEPTTDPDRGLEDLHDPPPRTTLMPSQTSPSSLKVYRRVSGRPWYYYQFESPQIHFKIGTDWYALHRSQLLRRLSRYLVSLFQVWMVLTFIMAFTVTNGGFTGFWPLQLFRFPDPVLQTAYDVFMVTITRIPLIGGALLSIIETPLYLWEKRHAKQRITIK